MSRHVRLGATVDDDVTAQLNTHEAELFWRHDLAAALVLLSRDGVWESLPDHGGGRRLTVEGITVGARISILPLGVTELTRLWRSTRTVSSLSPYLE